MASFWQNFDMEAIRKFRCRRKHHVPATNQCPSVIERTVAIVGEIIRFIVSLSESNADPIIE
jgi:hypothetical protein